MLTGSQMPMVIPGLLRLHDSWLILIVMDLEFVSDFML